MEFWTGLQDVLTLLLAATLLGALCERFRQSAILGYLIAGTLLGPNAFGLLRRHEQLGTIAELGVALLLFTIGLEFSWRRLRSLGAIAVGGGSIQIVLTLAVGAIGGLALGLPAGAAFAVGAMVALSSTACVLRLLAARTEIDSIYGRNALGILLMQDIAVVPLVVLVTVLADAGPFTAALWQLGRTIALAGLLVAVLYAALNYMMPFLLGRPEAAVNRELAVLLAIITAVGTAWASHALGLSPALGAFLAGILLAESPFSAQVRADVAALRILFVTLFFSSVGTQADLNWVLANWDVVTTVVCLVIVGKGVLTAGATRLFQPSWGHAAATGLCLAQIGEFSFVLAKVASDEGLIGEDVFRLMISATIGTLLVTPYLVSLAPRMLRLFQATRPGVKPPPAEADDSGQATAKLADHIVIIGFGPAGQRVAESLMAEHKAQMLVIELNAKSAAIARDYGLPVIVGDAALPEVLEHAHLARARIAAVTIPDPRAAGRIVEIARATAPHTPVVVRARYHRYRWMLTLAGAQIVVDEEDQVGRRIAIEVQGCLGERADSAEGMMEV